MALSQQTKPPSIFKILCEAFKLTTKNLTRILSIILISISTSFLLAILFRLSIIPLVADLTAKSNAIASLDPNSPEFAIILAAIIKDTKELLGGEALFILTSIIVSSFVAIAIVRALSAAINTLPCTLSTGWKGPILTALLVQLLSLGYAFLCGAVFGVFVYAARGSMILTVCGAILALSAFILYLYLAMVWSVSVVVSVVEDGCYGLNAISKAGETVGGRRLRGLMLSLIQSVIAGASFAAYKLVSSRLPSSLIALAGITLVYAVIGALGAVYGWAVIVVFYRDCRRSNGEKGMEMDGGFAYSSLPTASYIDEV